jgi:hypothetical protein
LAAGALALPTSVMAIGLLWAFWRRSQRPRAGAASKPDFSVASENARGRDAILARDIEARWR